MADHELLPSLKTAHWGYFDSTLTPVLTIQPGETICIHTMSGGTELLPAEGSGPTVRPEHRAIVAALPRGPGPHILTGPVAVAGAEPGDALKVEILDIQLREDWGYNLLIPLVGTLPEAISEPSRIHLRIDCDQRLVHTPWGFDIPADPFFGVMGTAPPRGWGRQSSVAPRAFGGNLDNKLLTPGATLYLPVFEPGGLFSVGDGHAVQGDGEVCITAVETGLIGTFRISLVKGAKLALPRAETATHHITMAFDEDLDRAARIALRAMIDWITAGGRLTFEDAYRLCSLVVDMRITQLVNQQKGVHAMLPKWTGVVTS